MEINSQNNVTSNSTANIPIQPAAHTNLESKFPISLTIINVWLFLLIVFYFVFGIIGFFASLLLLSTTPGLGGILAMLASIFLMVSAYFFSKCRQYFKQYEKEAFKAVSLLLIFTIIYQGLLLLSSLTLANPISVIIGFIISPISITLFFLLYKNKALFVNQKPLGIYKIMLILMAINILFTISHIGLTYYDNEFNYRSMVREFEVSQWKPYTSPEDNMEFLIPEQMIVERFESEMDINNTSNTIRIEIHDNQFLFMQINIHNTNYYRDYLKSFGVDYTPSEDSEKIIVAGQNATLDRGLISFEYIDKTYTIETSYFKYNGKSESRLSPNAQKFIESIKFTE